ncbi:MAG: bifunctional folylpolyglutamate synthase/dihydrofolate synthase, partial [Planctomycetaceae bacterium]
RGFKLDRMRGLLARLGDPQSTIPAVHIAGTKGKGSTAVMAAEILTAAGLRTGLFTSPHISAFEERMRVDGQTPAQPVCIELLDRVARTVRELDALGAEMRATYFEIATAIAWLFFVRERCDVAVLEVGLGGRLDSTNLCRPLVTVITNISRDHMHVLGNTVTEIAAEKAGIIKPGIPIVNGAIRPAAAAVIDDAAMTQASPLYRRHVDFRSVYRREGQGAVVDVETPYGRYESIPLALAGAHQADNAALAITVADVLGAGGFEIPREAVRRGMANVCWPLRLEVLSRDPTIVVDAAHNEASAAALVGALRAEFSAERRILVFAASRDKDVERIAAVLFPAFNAVVLTQFVGNPRSIPPDELQSRVDPAGVGFPMAPSPMEALSQAIALAGARDLICATGSFYLAAEVREVALERRLLLNTLACG